MIDAEGQRHLRELQKHVKCERRFACVDSALSDLCKGIYHTDLDIFECLRNSEAPCEFCRPFSSTFVCTCPLRKYIARNFERWSAESTSVLVKRRPEEPGRR